MEHAEVLELIELAAAEPGGMARLAAGDTPEASAIAGHIAGCEACGVELARTARTAGIAREAIQELPDPALRARTLAYVREMGRDRSAPTAEAARVEAANVRAAGSGEPSAPESSVARHAAATDTPIASHRSWRGWWAAASVAAVLVAAVAGFAVGGSARPAATGDDAGGALAAAQVTMHIAQQPDVARVVLAAAGGAQGSGTLIFSATSGELAMTVTGLAPLPSGATYACWVEQGGQRRRIGVLYMDGADGTWAGKVSGLAAVPPGTSFGVSLVTDSASAGSPVLLGRT